MQVTEPEAAKSRLNFDRERTLSQIADLERDFAAIVVSAAARPGAAPPRGDRRGIAEGRRGQLRSMRYMRTPDWRRAPRGAPGRPYLHPLRCHPLGQPAPEATVPPGRRLVLRTRAPDGASNATWKGIAEAPRQSEIC